MKGATLLLALAALLVSDRSRAAEDNPSRVIIGYVFAENDSIDPATIAADKLTHINYAFANIQDGVVVEGFARDAENFKRARRPATRAPAPQAPDLGRRMDLVGGFSDAALTADEPAAVRRERGRASCGGTTSTASTWTGSIPGLPGDGNTHRPEDKQNFTAAHGGAAGCARRGTAREQRRALPADVRRGRVPATSSPTPSWTRSRRQWTS